MKLNLNTFSNAFQKAKEFQAGAKILIKDLEKTEVKGSSTDGLVICILDGHQRPLRVEISSACQGLETSQLSELVTEAVKNAYGNSLNTLETQMKELGSRLNIF